MKKKNYNPFKMGSNYVGGIIGLFLIILIFPQFFLSVTSLFYGNSTIFYPSSAPNAQKTDIFTGMMLAAVSLIELLLPFVLFAIPGFILTWLITILWRKFK